MAKISVKKVLKDLSYGFMSGAATTWNGMVTATCGVLTYHAIKAKNKKNALGFAWCTAVGCFSTYLAIKNEVQYIDEPSDWYDEEEPTEVNTNDEDDDIY